MREGMTVPYGLCCFYVVYIRCHTVKRSPAREDCLQPANKLVLNVIVCLLRYPSIPCPLHIATDVTMGWGLDTFYG